MLPRFQPVGILVQEKKFKIDFPRWWPGLLSWISNLKDFSYFLSISHPNTCYQVSRISLSVQVKFKICISNWKDFSYFWSIFAATTLPTKFQVNWPFGSGGKVPNRFLRWPHLEFRIGMILAIFDLQVTPIQLAQVGRRSSLLNQIVDAALCMTDIDQSQQLTLSTSCSHELIKSIVKLWLLLPHSYLHRTGTALWKWGDSR